jgi:hypothetical protein
MNCEIAEEYVSALCDGQKIPLSAAEHIGQCKKCQLEMNEYAAIGVELRRLASVDEPIQVAQGDWKVLTEKDIHWWQRGLTTMKIPKLAFGVMLMAIVTLSSSLVMVQARAGSGAGRFLELKYKLPSASEPNICVMRADGSQKDNTCDFIDHGREGLLLINTRVIANAEGRAQLGIRAKYIPGAQDTELHYSEALFNDVPQVLLAVEPGKKQEISVANLGVLEAETEYLDHIPPLVYRPQETLDPQAREFRIVAPVLVRDNEVIANSDGSSIDTGSPDATLMYYVPGEGRYLVSLVPFDRAVEGRVQFGRVTFFLEGHNYLLLTSMPITVSDHVWVKHESDFKPSERMARASDADNDRPMFLVRSLRKLEDQRIQH